MLTLDHIRFDLVHNSKIFGKNTSFNTNQIYFIDMQKFYESKQYPFFDPDTQICKIGTNELKFYIHYYPDPYYSLHFSSEKYRIEHEKYDSDGNKIDKDTTLKKYQNELKHTNFNVIKGISKYVKILSYVPLYIFNKLIFLKNIIFYDDYDETHEIKFNKLICQITNEIKNSYFEYIFKNHFENLKFENEYQAI